MRGSREITSDPTRQLDRLRYFSSLIVVGKVYRPLRQLQFRRLHGYEWKVSKRELYPRVLRPSRGLSRCLGAQTIAHVVES